MQLQDVGSSSAPTGKAELDEMKQQNEEMAKRIAQLEKNAETPAAIGQPVFDQQPKV